MKVLVGQKYQIIFWDFFSQISVCLEVQFEWYYAVIKRIFYHLKYFWTVFNYIRQYILIKIVFNMVLTLHAILWYMLYPIFVFLNNKR